MKYLLKRFAQFFSFAAVLTAPLIVSAQTVSNITSLFAWVLNMLNEWIVPLIFALAFIMFLIGVFRYFIAGGADEEKVKQGQKFVLWSMVGFVLMFCLWGIINIFVNTLQFSGANEPGLPQFSANGLSNTGFAGLVNNPLSAFLGGNSNSTASTGLTTGSSLVDPQTGTQYIMTSPTTFAPNPSTGCGSVGVLSGNVCRINASAAGTGSLTAGQNCTTDSQCNGDLACNTTSHTCQVDPTLENSGYGKAAGNVTSGGTCKTNDDCAGNLACSSNGVCTTDGSLDGPGYGDGDGTVQQGGACEDANDCSGNLTCTNGVCAVDSQLDAGDGSQGSACQNSDQCNDVNGVSMTCINSQCEPDNGLEQQGDQCSSNDDCQGNLSCQNGTCQVDSSLDSQDNYVDPDSSSGSGS